MKTPLYWSATHLVLDHISSPIVSPGGTSKKFVLRPTVMTTIRIILSSHPSCSLFCRAICIAFGDHLFHLLISDVLAHDLFCNPSARTLLTMAFLISLLTTCLPLVPLCTRLSVCSLATCTIFPTWFLLNGLLCVVFCCWRLCSTVTPSNGLHLLEHYISSLSAFDGHWSRRLVDVRCCRRLDCVDLVLLVIQHLARTGQCSTRPSPRLASTLGQS